MEKINLPQKVIVELTPAEISTVLSLLRKGIYEQVSPVINSIEKQIVEQCKPKEELVNGQQ